jgi:hypothetical protein
LSAHVIITFSICIKILLKFFFKLKLSKEAMFSKFLTTSGRQGVRGLSSVGKASLEGFGRHLFKGAVAAPYLEAQGLSKDTLNDSAWTMDGAKADKVANAVKEWATDK